MNIINQISNALVAMTPAERETAEEFIKNLLRCADDQEYIILEMFISRLTQGRVRISIYSKVGACNSGVIV